MLPEVGMKQMLKGSFSEMVQAFAQIVARNPAFAQKYKWPTDRTGQEDFVDEHNAQRLLKSGFVQFVDLAGATPPYDASPGVKKNWRQVAAAVTAGGKSWSRMLSPGGHPVDRTLALQRAGVCLSCPKHDTTGGFGKYFLKATAASLQAAAGVLKDLHGCKTEHDEKLGICTACLCPVRSKIWFPIEYLTPVPDDVWPELSRNPACWLLTETHRP
jgi:hypothetical protein